MTQLLVRNLDNITLETLKQRAKLHHRSLQGEILFILKEVAHASEHHQTSGSPDVLKKIIGGWQGELLTRPEQGEYDQRDELE